VIPQGNWPEDLNADEVASAIIAVIQSISLMNAKLSPSRTEQAIKQLERWLMG
jgi:hypothetical protein